jgi:hypothetical protein
LPPNTEASRSCEKLAIRIGGVSALTLHRDNMPYDRGTRVAAKARRNP